jgi:excisionase family DNA binding protein
MDNTIETGGARTVQVEVLSDDVARAEELAAASGGSVEQVYAIALAVALRVLLACERVTTALSKPLKKERSKTLKEVYTTGDVARVCGVTAATIVDWARDGKIESLRTPGNHRRFAPSVVRAFLERNGYPVPKELLDL